MALTPEAWQAFAKSNEMLVDAVQLGHLRLDAPSKLIYDVSNDSFGTALHWAVMMPLKIDFGRNNVNAY